LKNRARQRIRSPWWLDERLGCGFVTRSPAGGGPCPRRLRCAAVEGPDLLICCALPCGRIPRFAASQGFSTASGEEKPPEYSRVYSQDRSCAPAHSPCRPAVTMPSAEVMTPNSRPARLPKQPEASEPCMGIPHRCPQRRGVTAGSGIFSSLCRSAADRQPVRSPE
jgi:hypothetical protein